MSYFKSTSQFGTGDSSIISSSYFSAFPQSIKQQVKTLLVSEGNMFTEENFSIIPFLDSLMDAVHSVMKINAAWESWDMEDPGDN